jgi:hypothetical protein
VRQRNAQDVQALAYQRHDMMFLMFKWCWDLIKALSNGFHKCLFRIKLIRKI